MRAHISVEGLTVGGGASKTPTLVSASFVVGTGQFAEITGAVASGKTTLCRALVGALNPDAGQIVIGGHNVKQISSAHLGSFFGYVPETVVFFPGTIAANIAHMAGDWRKQDVEQAARAARAHAFIAALPKGYHTRISAVGTPLSRCQGELICLARALYRRPQVLLLDDPADVVLEVLDDGLIDDVVARDGAVVVTGRKSHNLRAPRRRWVLRDGSLRETSAPVPIEELSAPSKSLMSQGLQQKTKQDA